jgi:hypothetical protein
MIQCESTGCECYRIHYDFAQFVLVNKSIKRVRINKDQWQVSTCTCKKYLKAYMCKHIIAVAVKLRLAKIDFSYLNIGMKKKRGRKPQAKEWFVKN